MYLQSSVKYVFWFHQTGNGSVISEPTMLSLLSQIVTSDVVIICQTSGNIGVKLYMFNVAFLHSSTFFGIQYWTCVQCTLQSWGLDDLFRRSDCWRKRLIKSESAHSPQSSDPPVGKNNSLMYFSSTG